MNITGLLEVVNDVREISSFKVSLVEYTLEEFLLLEDNPLDAPTTDYDEKRMSSFFDRTTVGKKDKRDKYNEPYVHNKTITNEVVVVDEDGKRYDMDKLRSYISKRPTAILKQNQKMQKSNGKGSVFRNIGLPALRGLVVDESTGQFKIVNTCPGAGACKINCYAMKGGYIQYPASSDNSTRMLNFLYNDPMGFAKQLEGELSSLEASNKGKDIQIRWHDAGDFFSPKYFELALNIARKFPSIKFYAYTKMADVSKAEKPDNFITNFSDGALNSEQKQIDLKVTKSGIVVPKDMFSDILEKRLIKEYTNKKGKTVRQFKKVYKSERAVNTLKKRIAAKWGVDAGSILTYDEMMKIPEGSGDKKYHVIVKPGDGDVSATRRDVVSTFLLEH